MNKVTLTKSQDQEENTTFKDALDKVFRKAAREMLAKVIQEVKHYLDGNQSITNEKRLSTGGTQW